MINGEIGINERDSHRQVLQYNKKDIVGIMDLIAGFLIALCPILQHYNGLFTEAGSEVLILMMPYVVLKLIMLGSVRIRPILPLIAYAIFISTVHGFSPFVFFREMLLVVFFIAAINGALGIAQILQSATVIASFAAICIIIQYFFYYVFGVHLQMVPTDLLLDSASQWIGLATTGRISVTGTIMAIYRPSAFFLEPSHLSIYCIPVIALNLLSAKQNKKTKRISFLLSIAVILSTSGLGIICIAALWILYVMLYSGDKHREGESESKLVLQPKRILYISGLIIIFFGLYFSIGVFRSAVNRIFINSDSGNNAIQGRTTTGIRLMHMLSGVSVFIGRGTSYKISDWNVSGFFYMLFQYGAIGVILHYLFYLISIIVLKREYVWLALIIFGLSFFTVHTFASFYRLFLTIFLLSGWAFAVKKSTVKNAL